MLQNARVVAFTVSFTQIRVNKLTSENFAGQLAQANLGSKTYFGGKGINLNKKVTSNKQNMSLLKMN